MSDGGMIPKIVQKAKEIPDVDDKSVDDETEDELRTVSCEIEGVYTVCLSDSDLYDGFRCETQFIKGFNEYSYTREEGSEMVGDDEDVSPTHTSSKTIKEQEEEVEKEYSEKVFYFIEIVQNKY